MPTETPRTGALNIRRSYVIARWGDANYRTWVEQELHALMQAKLFEIVSDGRDYVIRVDRTVWEVPGEADIEFGMDTCTLHYSALVLLRRLDQARIEEYVAGEAYHAPPSKGLRHLAVVPGIGKVELELTRFTSHLWDHEEPAWRVVPIYPM